MASTPAAPPALAADVEAPAVIKFETFSADCALFIDKSLVLAGDASTAPQPTALRLRYSAYNVKNAPPALGFRIHVPFSDAANQLDNENIGHGVSHIYSTTSHQVVQASCHHIVVRFPPGQYDVTIHDEGEPEHQAICPPGKKFVSVTVRLHEGARCAIFGYGIPYANTKDKALEAMINDDAPLPCGLSILDIFTRRDVFTFAVQTATPSSVRRTVRHPPAFAYPYGSDHSWDENKFHRLLDEIKSDKPFPANFPYWDNNSFVAVNVQFNVQDSFWLDAAAREIAAERWPAYFVNTGTEGMPCMVV